VALTAAQTFVGGALEVLIVVLALRILHGGNGAVGWLNTGMGVGCLFGVVAVASLARRKRLAADFGIGVFLWGVPVALAAAWANLGFAVVLFALLGIGNTLVDVSGMTLLQRTADEDVLARVFGVFQSLLLVTMAAGALVAPALVSGIGPRTTFVVVGALLPTLLVFAWPALARIDREARVPTEAIDLLRSLPLFAPLPQTLLERLAGAATEVRVPPMTAVITQGEAGDRFYVIRDGHAAVEVDGAETGGLGPGDFFGEIALLRDVPRTATVRAVEALDLYALERDDFLAAVTGYAPSRAAADSIVAARLPAGAALSETGTGNSRRRSAVNAPPTTIISALPRKLPQKSAVEPKASVRKSHESTAFPASPDARTPAVRFRFRSGVKTAASTVSETMNATREASATFCSAVQPAASPTR
jgi:hypothetical protein